jgi:hypothetical protein
MRCPSTTAWFLAAWCLTAPLAVALPSDTARVLPGCTVDDARRGPWAVEFGSTPEPAVVTPLDYSSAAEQAAAPARRAVPVEYSDGYRTRAKIHRYASFATLPLFVANYLVGQDLYNNPGDESKKGLHVGLVTGSAVLFGVNTFTGAWNLWEGRNDPNHRAKRMTHAVLMMAADVGFLATAMLAPEGEGHEHGGVPTAGSGSASTHRAVALTSMGIATVSYLIMLIGGH